MSDFTVRNKTESFVFYKPNFGAKNFKKKVVPTNYRIFFQDIGNKDSANIAKIERPEERHDCLAYLPLHPLLRVVKRHLSYTKDYSLLRI